MNCFHKSWQKSCTQCSDCEILLNSFNVTYEIYVVTISKHHAMVGHEDTNVMLGARWWAAASFISKLKHTLSTVSRWVGFSSHYGCVSSKEKNSECQCRESNNDLLKKYRATVYCTQAKLKIKVFFFFFFKEY